MQGLETSISSANLSEMASILTNPSLLTDGIAFFGEAAGEKNPNRNAGSGRDSESSEGKQENLPTGETLTKELQDNNLMPFELKFV